MAGTDTRLFVARVSQQTRTRDIEDLFGRFGRLRDVVVKQGYAFVEYDDPRDARDAFKDLDGYKLDGERIVIEYSRRRGEGGGGGGRGDRDGGDRFGGGDHRGRGRGGDRDDRGRGPPRGGGRFTPPHNTDYRLLARNLPPRADWRDLKDFFREAGKVCFADVRRDKDGSEVGVVEFESMSDLENAIKKLDGQKLHGTALQLINDSKGASGGGGGGGRSRSRSPRGRSPARRSPSPARRSRSPRRSASRSRSPAAKRSPPKRSPSPAAKRTEKEKSRSPSPKRSPSPGGE